MATYKLLASYTVGAGGTASVTFNDIPQIYSDLLIKTSLREVTTNTWAAKIYFNNSNSSITEINAYSNSTNTYSHNNENSGLFTMNASNTTANSYSNSDIYISNYASSNYKVWATDNAADNNSADAYAFITGNKWTNTSPITTINFTSYYGGANGDKFAQYSTFYIYGIWADSSTGTPSAPTIGTATAYSFSADVPFTPAGSGNTAMTYTAISTPGSITATGTSSPISVTGLTGGTSYTFKVAGVNPYGTGTYSAASNQVTTLGSTFYSIATQSVGAGGASSITFSSIPSGYSHLQIRGISRLTVSTTDTDQGLFYRFNSDTGSNYAWHLTIGASDGSSNTVTAYNSTNATYLHGGTAMTDKAAANVFNISVIDILDYANTNKNKVVKTLNGASSSSDPSKINISSGLWMNTNAITNINIFPAIGGFSQYSQFVLYGIK